MGGDFGPRVTVPAVLGALGRHSQLQVVLYGDERLITSQIPHQSDALLKRLQVKHCEQEVAMHDKPSSVIRNKRKSSMWQCVQSVADGNASAAVSAGNTGALMAISLLQLRTIEGIDRPAICTQLPTLASPVYLLDMGANLECSPGQLHQFAAMATLVATEVDGLESPRVGLLNIGEEESKGHNEIREAAELLKTDANINYIGYIEGDALFSGAADVVVCDGFSGNVALKSAEGVARMFADSLREVLSGSLRGRLAALMAKPALAELKQRMSPSNYNGASLLGLNGIVIKSHGGADCYSFGRAIEVAIHEAEKDLPALIGAWAER